LHGFALDDIYHIVENPAVRSLEGGFSSFDNPIYPGNLYRPIVILSYSLTYLASGLDPLPFHATNILLHAGCTLVLYALFKNLLGKQAGFVAALLFAVHPVHVEVVANVSGRTELLSFLFGVAALVAFLGEYIPPWKIILGLDLFALALLSKESAAVLLLLMPLCNYLKYGLPPSRDQVNSLSGMLLVFLGYLFLRMHVLEGVPPMAEMVATLDNPLVAVPPEDRVLTALALLWRYLSLMILPLELSADYSYAEIPPLHGVKDLLAHPEVFAIAALGVSAAVLAWRRSAIGFAMLWFFAAFSVTSNVLTPIGTIFGERLLFLPGVGVLALLGIAFERARPVICGRFLPLALVLLFALQTVQQGKIWKDNDVLHSHQIKVSPWSAKTQANYAAVLLLKGDLVGASAHFRKALAIYPNYSRPAYLLGVASYNQGDVSEAERWLKRAVAIEPGFVPAENALGQLYFNFGKFSEARKQFERVLANNPKDVDARVGLLGICIRAQKKKNCGEAYEQLRKEYPKHPGLARVGAWLEGTSSR
jgi:tetratricopeptide (TPR) repeat protein